MKNGYTKRIALLIGFLSVVFTSGCHKRVATAQPNVLRTAQPAPTASLTANPASIERGQSTTLMWQTSNATEINIKGIGTVPALGARSVSPMESTTYQLVAKGPGGSETASARVTVTAPTSLRPFSTQPGPSKEELFSGSVQDVFFDFDRYNIRPDQMPSLQVDAQFLKQHAGIRVLIEGHCDERGSEEYNLALGDERAAAVQRTLVQLGIPAERVRTVSYGKERPFCNESNEQCWQQNRRGHFVSQH